MNLGLINFEPTKRGRGPRLSSGMVLVPFPLPPPKFSVSIGIFREKEEDPGSILGADTIKRPSLERLEETVSILHP